MRRTLVPALMALAAAALLGACGSNASKTSPVSPSALTGAVTVNVALATPRGGSVKPADVLQLKATALFGDGSTSDCTDAATWTSSNEQVARVSAQKHGEVTTVSGGDAKITAACGPLKADFPVTVIGITQVTAALPFSHPSALVIGERMALLASAQFTDGTTETCPVAVTAWTSSDPSIVTITSDGTLQAVAPGNATINSTCRGVSSALALSVRPGLRIRGLENEPFVLLVSPRISIYTDLVDERGNVGPSCHASFSSSDPTVLSVVPSGSGGMIVPSKLGDATITATCGANAAATMVRVARYNVVGTVRDSNGTPIAGASVEAYLRRSSDTDAPTSATTSAADGSYVLPTDISPANIAVTAPGYDSTMLPAVTWNRQATMTAPNAQLTPTRPAAPPPHLLDFSDTVCNAANFPAMCPGSTLVKGRNFPGYTSGRLRVETSLDSVPSNASVVFALYCGYGSSVDLPYQWESDTVRYYQLPGGCSTNYELRVSNMSTYPKVTFHVTADIK